MTLKLYMHPISSYSHKALIAFYENEIAFEPRNVGDQEVYAELEKLWPIARFPLLRDEARDWTVPESTIVIEYLQQYYPGPVRLIPDDPDLARQVRMRDRFFDNYLHTPLQKMVDDCLRPRAERDPWGVAAARKMYRLALDQVERAMDKPTWQMGEDFTLADCAAAPALFYGRRFFGPFDESHPNAMAYLARLLERPSYARALREAEPLMHLVPQP